MSETILNRYKGKKILILGANAESIDLVIQAKKMGAKVYVADYNPKAPAKKFADKAVNIDGLDVEALTAYCIKEHMDAVLVGVADRLVKPYYALCTKLNLPCYVSQLSSVFLTDKIEFNNICKRFEIPTIPYYKVNKNNSYDNIQYPCFVKPPDGNSGKGMSVCYHPSQLAEAIEKAKKNSQTGRYYIDKYMNTADMFVYFTIANGNVFLSATADRFTCASQSGVSKVCLGGVYPSKYDTMFKSNMLARFVKMIEFLEIRNGVLMVSAFVDNDKFYFYDPGFRLQGEAPNNIIYAANKINQLELLVDFAFTGNMNDNYLSKHNDSELNGQFGSSIWFLLTEGEISKINWKGKETGVKTVGFSQRLFEGDSVTPEMIGTEAQVLARAYIITKSEQQLKNSIKSLQRAVEVVDDVGKNMLIEGFEYV
jgi:biotin carboxylase